MTKTTVEIADTIEKALSEETTHVTRTAIGGGLGRNHTIYTLNVTLETGEKFYISVTKLD